MKWTCTELFLVVSFLFSSFLLNVATSKPSPSDKTRDARLTAAEDAQLEQLILKRIFVVHELNTIQQSLYDLIDSFDGHFDPNEPEIRKLIKDLDTKWLEMGDLNEKIRPYKIAKGSEQLELEVEYNRQLMDDRAAILHKAKLRRCKSRKETYFKPEEKCYPIEDKSNNPCQDDQLLFDGPKNEGICDCEEKKGLVYHLESRKCYKANSQGPCAEGQWYAFNESKAVVCQKRPEGCPADGDHVIFSGKCWKLGSTGPCTDGTILIRQEDDLTRVDCDTADKVFLAAPALGEIAGRSPSSGSCPAGSSRDVNNNCRPVFG